MKLEALILVFLYLLCINCADTAADKYVIDNFNNFDDSDGCPWIKINLPEQFKMIVLDERNLSFSGDHCETTQGYTEGFECQQTKNSTGYTATARICDGKKYFRIGWELENFHVENRITQITQFVVSAGNWNTNSMSCIQPQYSLPLVRESVVGDETVVTCAIQLSLCCNVEAVVIFGLTETFCEYNDQVQTCDREVLDKDTIVFSTKVPKEAKNKYYPDQYVFCNSVGSYMSTKIIWDTSTDFEDNLSAKAVDATSIEVSWMPPKHVAPDLVYRLTVGTHVQDIKERDFHEIYVMGGFTPNTNYNVSLCFILMNPGSVSPCLTTSVTTPSSTEFEDNLSAKAVGATSIEVSWQPPKHVAPDLVYRLTVGTHVQDIRERDFHEIYVMGGLKPNTNYKVPVCLVFRNPDSLAPCLTTFVTTPSITVFEDNLSAKAIGATSIEVCWKPPKHVAPDLIYRLTVGTHVQDIKERDFHEKYVMGGLKPNTNYKVSVCLVFRNPDSLAPCLTTSVTTPSKRKKRKKNN